MPSRDSWGGASVLRIDRWAVWSVPRELLAGLLTVELTALGLVVVATVHTPSVPGSAWVAAAALLVLGVLHAEIAAGVERLRRRMVDGTIHVGLTSVWTFAGALILPASLAAALCVLLQVHDWTRTGKPRVAAYRTAFSTATIVLACLAARAVVTGTSGTPVSGVGGLGVVLLAAGAYATVNTALIAGAVAATVVRPGWADTVGDWDDNLIEFAALSVGALVAANLMGSPWLVALAVPPLVVLQRAVLVRRLQEAASTDAKTGLLNAATWQVRAEAALRRVARTGSAAVMVLDLDHFKAVNDTHGHLAGDQVLAAVADAVRGEVRDRDLVGRFGGEEFVVLLDSGSGEAVESVAERIRRRVAGMRVELPTADGPLTVAGLSISIGCAVLGPGEPADLTDLVRAADMAVLAAKRAGRNRVRTGRPRHGEPTPAVTAVPSMLTVRDESSAQDHPDVRPLSP